jgi:hypothetical protein
MREIVLRLTQQPFIVGNGTGDLVALAAERQYRNRFSRPLKVWAKRSTFLWHLRQHTGQQRIGLGCPPVLANLKRPLISMPHHPRIARHRSAPKQYLKSE